MHEGVQQCRHVDRDDEFVSRVNQATNIIRKFITGISMKNI